MRDPVFLSRWWATEHSAQHIPDVTKTKTGNSKHHQVAEKVQDSQWTHPKFQILGLLCPLANYGEILRTRNVPLVCSTLPSFIFWGKKTAKNLKYDQSWILKIKLQAKFYFKKLLHWCGLWSASLHSCCFVCYLVVIYQAIVSIMGSI